MATVQISFQDASNNETSFEVYRGANSGAAPTAQAAEKLATITWNGTNDWTYTKEAIDTAGSNDGAFTTSGNPGNSDPSNTGQQFTFRYTESATGDFVYGVIAVNSIGPSAQVNSSAITLT